MFFYPPRYRLTAFALLAGTASFLILFSDMAAAASADASLAPINVTAARMAQTANQRLASVSVITRRDIEREQPHDVLDALRSLPGVDIARQGGYGQLTSVFLRGTNSNQVLVLVDGVPSGSVSSGATSWEFIPIDLVERIEVVRGPLSSLYGANAVGGVIQIFTRKAHHANEADASVGGGTYGTRSAHAGGGLRRGRTRLRADVSIFHTDGFNAHQNTGGVTEPDADGYFNRALSLGFSQGLRKRDQLQLQGFHAEGYTQFDPTFSADEPNMTDFVQQVISGAYRLAVTDNDTLTFRAGQSLDKRDTFRRDSPAPHQRFDSTRNHFTVMNSAIFGAGSFNFGIDDTDDRLDSDTAFDQDSRNDYGVFGEYTGHFGAQDIQLSLRHDQDQQFGGYNTGSIAWGYDITSRYRVTASYGTAFRAPTFNDLYYPGFGNPDLKPEKSRSVEFGLHGVQSWGDWDLRAYQTRIRDLITLGPAPTYLPVNLGRARIRGVTLDGHHRVGVWQISAGASYRQALNRDTDKDLPRRPRAGAHLDVDREIGRWSAGASLIANGDSYDDPANDVRLAGYALLQLRAGYRFTRHWRIQAQLDNALDRHYETVAGYNSPGAAGYVTLTWNLAPED